MITALLITIGLLATGCILLFLLWQKEIGMDYGHCCDEDCYEWGCEESGDLYIPSEGVVVLQGDTFQAAIAESMRDLMLTPFPLHPIRNAKIVNITPAGLTVPFQAKKD